MAKKRQETVPPEDVMVAIDLGSSGVRAMVAQRLNPDTLRVLGVEKSTRYQCVDRGVVVQTGSAGYMINETIKLLANRLKVDTIPQAFVVLGGVSMKVVHLSWKKDLIRSQAITTTILDTMEKECRMSIERQNAGVAVLGLVPCSYILDKHEQTNRPEPTEKATLLEVVYTAFVGKKELEQKVQDSFIRASKVEEMAFARPEALMSAITTGEDDVWERGCAVLDMGAQTTTLSIYKGSQYLACKVVPMGSWHITRLIEQQGMDIRYAEALKTRYGVATPEAVEQDMTMNIPTVEGDGSMLKVKSSELATLIQMKLDEIMTPLLPLFSEYEERIGTLYLTGGGCMIQGMQTYMQQKTRMEVTYGSHAHLLAAHTEDEYYSPEYSALVGALILGSDYRILHPQHVQKRTRTWKDMVNKLRDGFADQAVDIFTPQTKSIF